MLAMDSLGVPEAPRPAAIAENNRGLRLFKD